MRFFFLLLLFFYALTFLQSQNTTCKTLWEGEGSDGQYYLGGRIDKIHAIRIFLCRNGNKLKGYYEMVSSKKLMDVEGFLKGDSIFLAEYSANQKVMGMIKGYLRDSSYVADMTTPEGIYNGTITARLQKNWALCKKPINPDFAKIMLYKSAENPDQQMLISYPNDYAFRGILNDEKQHKTFYFSGRNPEKKEKQYKITTLTHAVSTGKITCSLQNDQFVQSTLTGISNKMKPTITIPLDFIEKTDRRSAYEIHFPFTGNKKADLSIEMKVSEISHQFDSIYNLGSVKDMEDEPFGRSTNMIAWFEPSFVSKKWLCGHFIVHNSLLNQSKVIAYNYNYAWNRTINLEELIRIKAGQDINWDKVIADEKGQGSVDTSSETYGEPAVAYSGVLLTSNYDRLYDRQQYQTASKIKGLKWKWWKANYWIFKSQQI